MQRIITVVGVLALLLVLGLLALRSMPYAGLSRDDARREANAALAKKGPAASGYTSFVNLGFRSLEKGREPLGPKAWIASYSGTDPQSRNGAALCIWLRRSGDEVVSHVGLC